MGAAWVGLAFLAAAVAVITGIVLLATGRLRDGLPEAPADHSVQGLPDSPVGDLAPTALEDLQIDQAWRGYRMDEVDAVIDRLGAEIAARDEQIAELRGDAPVTAKGEAADDPPSRA